jgi:hypothetical protein
MDQLRDRVVERRGVSVIPTAHPYKPHPFTEKASGQIFGNDASGCYFTISNFAYENIQVID